VDEARRVVDEAIRFKGRRGITQGTGIKGSARERWGTLTDDDWETIAGKKEQLVGRILAKAEAATQPDEWSRVPAEPKHKSHGARHS
jgi:hypothetical protein